MSDHRYSVSSVFEDCHDEWLQLQEGPCSYPFQTYEWTSCWWDTIGKAEAKQIAIVRIYSADSSLSALLPLCVQKKKGFRCLCFMGGRLADYCAPVILPECNLEPQEILGILKKVGLSLGCHLVYLSNVPEVMADGSANPLLDQYFPLQGVESHQAELGGDFESFFAGAFSAKSRYNLRRSEKLLAEEGKLEFRIAQDEGSRAEITAAMIEQKRARYRATGVADLFDKAEYSLFFAELNRRTPGMVHVSAIYQNGKPIATHWGLNKGERLYYLMPSFAEGETEKFSPGSILTKHILEDCARRGIEVVDFTLGDEAYKKNWCNGSTRLFRRLLPISPLGAAVRILDTAQSHLKR